MSAPSAASFCACASAACGAKKRPPSEKESGVTFTMPMMTGRAATSEKNRSRDDSIVVVTLVSGDEPVSRI
jgi:hypothetical protein